MARSVQLCSEFVQGSEAERVLKRQGTLEEAAAEVKFFSQPKDFFLALGRPVTKHDLDSKIMVIERAMNKMPYANLCHPRILLAALDDDPATAHEHLRRALKFHPQHGDAIVTGVRARIGERTDEFSLLVPLIEEEEACLTNKSRYGVPRRADHVRLSTVQVDHARYEIWFPGFGFCP